MKQLLLVNNGGYENRGCQAIEYSLSDILTGKDFKFYSLHHDSFPARPLGLKKSCVGFTRGPAFSSSIFSKIIARLSRGEIFSFSSNAKRLAKNADIILSVGGDNYSLDYGFPNRHIALDALVSKLKKRTSRHYLYCGSVGPFSGDANKMKKVKRALAKFDGIIVREKESLEYLGGLGIENLKLIPDPAFCLEYREKKSTEEFGFNISPIIAKGLGREELLTQSEDLISRLVKKYSYNVVLVPHVEKKGNDDRELLLDLLVRLQAQGIPSRVIESGLDCREIKSEIASLKFFIGARTHSCIAAMSSYVPAVTIGYSMKSTGISKLLWNDSIDVVPLKDLSVKKVMDVVDRMLSIKDSGRYDYRIKEIQHEVMAGNEELFS